MTWATDPLLQLSQAHRRRLTSFRHIYEMVTEVETEKRSFCTISIFIHILYETRWRVGWLVYNSDQQ